MNLPHSLTPRTLVAGSAALGAASLLVLSACGGGSSSNTDSNTVTVQGDVPIAYAKRVNTIDRKSVV